MKKVLIIAYYWPPAGGPGVQRWLKFVKYLREFEIEPVLFIPENPSYPITDKKLESEVPDNLQIIKRKIFEPYSLAGLFSKEETETISSGIIADEQNQTWLQSLMLYIRGNFFIPDARKFWIKPSVKFLKDFLQKEDIDTVITTGPPHSIHLIGMNLKEELPIQWIADFRDPWTQIGYHSKLKLTKKAQKKHELLEGEVLNTADKIIVTSHTTKAEFESKTKKPVFLITNGYDEVKFSEPILSDKKFSFSHIGSLLSGRNPKFLWESFRELIEEDADFKESFRLRLVGRVSPEVIKSIKENRLEEHLELIPYVSHREALIYQRKSQVLLLLEIDSIETRGIIPGKLFEYLNAKRPILAIGPEKWDVQKILEETGAGECFEYSDKEAMKIKLKKLFSAFKTANLNSEPQHIAQYSRKMLTGKLANLLR
ncbi:glycosyltransferase family 4 protein [Salegentibacter sediminis]|uniref:glycosyltransferase family 4 protein n=1 Tax=Salegentibacter sediminis TaxID=1930251 RepID=UPI0009BFF8F1|nr:glycosyltransferase family 4 protein [Salegentibacter sediminis]